MPPPVQRAPPRSEIAPANTHWSGTESLQKKIYPSRRGQDCRSQLQQKQNQSFQKKRNRNSQVIHEKRGRSHCFQRRLHCFHVGQPTAHLAASHLRPPSPRPNSERSRPAITARSLSRSFCRCLLSTPILESPRGREPLLYHHLIVAKTPWSEPFGCLRILRAFVPCFPAWREVKRKGEVCLFFFFFYGNWLCNDSVGTYIITK